MCMSVCGYVHVSTHAHGYQKCQVWKQELELQVIMSCLI